ncbi:MAG: 4a-hydroxytetrahydrobiopterin dehydratase [Sandaracinaceae bacterium]
MSTPLDDAAVEEALSALPGWAHVDHKLQKRFQRADFPDAIAFITRLAFEAEKRGHHPELRNVYATVDIALTTHDAGNRVTALDVELAKAIDAVA